MWFALTVDTQGFPRRVYLRRPLKAIDVLLDERPVEGLVAVCDVNDLENRRCSVVSDNGRDHG
jgi:hypothetical protein